jgi:hypothetical protein
MLPNWSERLFARNFVAVCPACFFSTAALLSLLKLSLPMLSPNTPADMQHPDERRDNRIVAFAMGAMGWSSYAGQFRALS